MRISAKKQAIWWGGAMLILLMALWGLGQAILPFLLGAGVAYLLDPLADRLERMGFSRTAAVTFITAAAVLIFITVLLVLIPTLVRQITQLVQSAPDMIDKLRIFLMTRFPNLIHEGGTVGSAMSELSTLVGEKGGKVVTSVLGSVMSVVSLIALLVIVPVVAFYLLLDWDNLIARIDILMPREHVGTVRRLASEIDETLSGFVRGQGTVMLILGTFYSLGLLIVGLPYGLAIGMMAALLSFIPYVGVLVGGATAIGVALFSFWGQPVWIGAVIAIFVIGQVVEGNYLQPKIVGNHVGLHPVWLLLALSVFGSMFGFVGMIVAVPLAAALGVLVRFAAGQYMESPLYTGQAVKPPAQMPTLVELVPSGTLAEVRAMDAASSQELTDIAAEAAEHRHMGHPDRTS